ncbi:hypothetical protein FE257_003524 [Aspergillus nanangensis]|uniref:Diphthine--ammonia ligase n=1 Tax=Aspergillus nanangensis TaxID=2582783 RepID=A0AAD4CBI2_ASPNN|nr:hypothetical protein FE257_003524 [Aspergillus nanangensis]
MSTTGSSANPQPTASGLNVIALISGGKDSLYSILHCIRNGHKVVALANLHPPPLQHHEHQSPDEEGDDLDSFMYQTIGHSVIPLYESALNIPLYRGAITGGAVDTARVYRDTAADHMAAGPATDETESLIPLLRRIMHAHPEANAVSAGAILSTYQRTRIENVAARLGLVPLAWLWMYPILPPAAERKGAPAVVSDAGLLEDMAAVGCEARIIKVASGGLDEAFLWGDVAGKDGTLRARILRAMKRFAAPGDLRGAVLGEGGEYESLALDGPAFLWKRRIEILDKSTGTGDGGVGFLRLKGARCVEKEAPADGADPVKPDTVRRPAVLDESFESVLNTLLAKEEVLKREMHRGQVNLHEGASGWGQLTQARDGGLWTISNITAPEAGPGAAEQMEAIASKIRVILENADGNVRDTADIVFSTVLLRSMDDFPRMNKVYVELFKKPNPAARATVACGHCLPDGVTIMVSVVVDTGPRDLRQGLHVQSQSYWAPANIGPYSQAMSIPLQGAERLIYVAGQIPLEPASMDMVDGSLVSETPSWFESYSLRTVLSLQHMWRIGTEMQADWWLGGVAYFTGEEHAASKAHIAWHAWESMYPAPAEEEEGDEGPMLDAWDIKYGGRAHEQTIEETPVLPNFDKVQANDIAPPFFAVQVEELPRGSDIEWQGLGYAANGLQLTCEVINDGQVIHTTTDEDLRYTAIELDLERSGSDLESSLRRVRETYCLPSRNAHAILYTSQPVSNASWSGQVVPCKSVWGQIGRRLAAGVVVQSRQPH